MPTKLISPETVEMLDGRVYLSDDKWETVWLRQRGSTKLRLLPKEEADLGRYYAVCAASASA